MAHPGSAHAILNIFRHRKTPHNFIILSGDVHYSFVYDVELRGEHEFKIYECLLVRSKSTLYNLRLDVASTD